jgi:hypothetical protein
LPLARFWRANKSEPFRKYSLRQRSATGKKGGFVVEKKQKLTFPPAAGELHSEKETGPGVKTGPEKNIFELNRG